MARPLLGINPMSYDFDHRQSGECLTGTAGLHPDLITIRGIVLPIDWDHRGNVSAMAISTYDEDEYLVENDEKGMALVAFIRKGVEVIGIVREAGGRQIITVKGMAPHPPYHASEAN